MVAAKQSRKRSAKKVVKKVTAICRTKGCTDKVHTRDLCDNHRQACARLVKRGETTWAELEAKGICGPLKTGGKKIGNFTAEVLRKTAKRTPKPRTKG